ncbi:MAG TPA: methionine--tRNA ligase [Chthoniobacteraceae bacterium]|nr:methionine--tRNA ligase [Chthoniobacteraceae bacterium]
MGKTFYITTAIDYTNAAPHIGHAYEKILADVLARYHRLKGERVFFLTGVDQHGQKVQQAAQKAGIEPAQYAREVTERFLALWERLGVGYDGWAATTDPRHQRCVQAILQRLRDEGQLYKASYGGFYSVRQEQFLTDKERGPDGNFGPEWGEVVHLEEENWYFRLAPHRDWLIAFVEAHPEFVVPGFRHTELLNAVRKLAGDLSISRPKERLAWGIDLPFDSGYVTYVWFDALINYISFAGYLSGGDPSLPDFDNLWPADAHVIGKDILVPAHGIYWPIMLHALGFPDEKIARLLVHGYINNAGEKMSKTLGNIIDPDALATKYSPEALRFYLMRDCTMGQDMEFAEGRLVTRFNTDLANGLGNLLNRTLNMSTRYRAGLLTRAPHEDAGVAEIEAAAAAVVETCAARMDDFQIHAALEAAWGFVTKCNQFIDTTAPFKLAKDPAQAQRLDAILYTLAESLRILAILTAPVLPRASAAIRAQLNVPGEPLLADAKWGGLADQHQLGKPEPVFPRIEAEKPV